MGGVIFVNALNIEDKVSIVVMLIVTRPIIIIDLYILEIKAFGLFF